MIGSFYSTGLKRTLPLFAASVLATFVSGLVLNAYYQASQYRNQVMRDVTIAAFIDTSGKTANEVIKERLINLDGVADVQFVAKEQVLERAILANPAMQEIMLSGENPFVPYYVIKPEKMETVFVQNLVDQLRGIGGIIDVRFDPNRVAVTEQLTAFRTVYRAAFQGSAAVALLIVLVRIVRRLFRRKFDAIRYVSLMMTGGAASIAGTLFYYLFSRSIVDSALVQMPDRYLAYLLLAGVTLIFIWETE